MSSFVSLSQNIALVFSLTFVYGLLQPRLERFSRQRQQLTKGLLFGLFGLISMTMPIQIAPGLFYDARTIVICIAAIYAGTLPVLMTALMVAIFRIVIGGIGVPGALVSIITATVIGLLVRRDRQRYGTNPRALLLLGIGLTLALLGSLWSIVFSRVDPGIIGQMLPTTLILYPLSMLLLGQLIDSQERSQADKRQLRESEHRFHAIFNSSFQFMGLLNPNGTVLDLNQTSLGGREAKAASFVGKPLWETNWGSSPERKLLLQDFVKRAVQGELVHQEMSSTLPNQGQATVDFTLKPLRDENGVVSLLLAEAHDITAVKELEQQKLDLALERERASLLKSFIADVSHDFRTPLSVMRLNLELLRRMSESPKQQQRIDVVAAQEQHLTRLLTDMTIMLSLDEYQGTFNFKPLDLNSVTQGVCETQRGVSERKQQKLIFNQASEPLAVQVDQVEIERALGKVLVNALNYTPAEGCITVNVLKQDHSAVVEIIDTGIGIAPDDLPNIFQRGFRADGARSMDTGGTGLGLPIARKIIEIHGGRIDVESTPAVGSTFRVLLPLPAAETDDAHIDPLVKRG
ncbi:MAG: PAS domain-containing protein [Chloroflexi bacterium]|nr:PAS domain-containing protein [Chloroflexota bacterium]